MNQILPDATVVFLSFNAIPLRPRFLNVIRDIYIHIVHYNHVNFKSYTIRPLIRVECLLPQLLQFPHDDKVRIEEAVHALPHTGLLVLVELAVLDGARGNALAEAGIGQGVDSCVC